MRAQIKESIKAPRHWPLCGEFTGDRWISAQRAGNAENVSIWWRHHGPHRISKYRSSQRRRRHLNSIQKVKAFLKLYQQSPAKTFDKSLIIPWVFRNFSPWIAIGNVLLYSFTIAHSPNCNVAGVMTRKSFTNNWPFVSRYTGHHCIRLAQVLIYMLLVVILKKLLNKY